MRLITTIAMLLLVMACVPVSRQPVTPHDAGGLDSRLFGAWYWAADDEYGYVHIGTHWKTGLLRVVMIDHRADGRLERNEYQGHSSQVDGHGYLNLQKIHSGGADADYLIVRYVIDDQGLGIALMEEEQLRKDIEQGALAGTIDGASERITADSRALMAYLLQKDAQLYPSSVYLKPLPRPAPTLAPEPDSRMD